MSVFVCKRHLCVMTSDMTSSPRNDVAMLG